jgi:hypothetical protein
VRQSWRFLPVRLAKGARTSSPSPRLTCLPGAASILGWRRQPVRRCCLPLHRPDDEATDASCRALPPGLACSASWGQRTKDPFHSSTPMPPLPRPEAPFTDRSRWPRPLLALRTRLRAATGPFGFAAVVQLPTRIHSYRYELGPAPEPVIHRSWRGHVPSIDFYSLWTPEHDHRCPNLDRFFATTEAAARRVTTPEGAANQAASA